MNMANKSARPGPVEGRLAAKAASTGPARAETSNIIRFAGYAAIFNRIDKGGDIIRPGAFGELPEGQSLPLLWQHDARQRIGRVDHVREDRRGLRVIGSISTETQAGRDAAAGLASGAMKGLSFGYRVNRSSGQKPRELIDLDVAEISLVTFPMQSLARVLRIE
ncbi:MAG: HK97 family phage prohead protease [Parasphingorhabdus sp.]|uniref:HK97 family phage prohead protease n=2 Tax=Parasphingorhabdus sp. TaxID=2709688 RepID=UPI0032640277